MEKYVLLDKEVGQTPLVCAENWRQGQPSAYKDVPLAYAGRLDPMASGKLLVLIGEECKKQTAYHNFDKEYEFSVLFGIGSDTHDVLGRLNPAENKSPFTGDLALSEWLTATSGREKINLIAKDLIGNITLPYPHFSAKTVQGKQLHTWTLENRLHEITIPTKESTIFELELTDIETISRSNIAAKAREKIDTIPPVTEERKALGNDFRREDVRKDWAKILSGNFNEIILPDNYTIAHFRCVCSSGTYMRSLAHLIGEQIETPSLAWHIHRTEIGRYSTAGKTFDLLDLHSNGGL